VRCVVRVAVVGASYIGLVSGVCLADFGHYVTFADTDFHRIDTILSGRTRFFESGLDELIRTNVAEGRARFSRETSSETPRLFIAVGTPTRSGDGQRNRPEKSEFAGRGNRPCA
jgi:UDPglucose 6-dehydrogenase